jgi:phospholipase/carboxylesterase
VVVIDRAEASRDLLQGLGYDIEWHEYLMPHSVCAEELDDISQWLKRVLTTA